MNSMPEPTHTNHRINDTHYHVGGSAGGPGENSAECACGVVFDGFDTHAEVTELLDRHITRAGTRLPGTVAELRAAAVTALQPYNPLNREHVESMLLFWVRRPEMTAADVAAVQEAMFPEPVDQPLKLWDCGKPGCPTHFAAGPCPRTQADEESTDADGGFAERFLDERRQQRLDVDDSDPRTLPGHAHGLVEGYARGLGFDPRPRIPRDLALGNPDWREGYAEGYVDAVQQAVGRRPAAGPRTVPNILPTPVTPICVVDSPNYCRTHEGIHPADLEELRELLGCPDWCVSEHAGDNPADPVENLILHFAAEHIRGVQVMRCDCPAEGWLGKPALRVRVELELETWEQAAELAHAVLDGFGYLAGAELP